MSKETTATALAIKFNKDEVIGKVRVPQNFANGQAFLRTAFTTPQITLTPVSKYVREVTIDGRPVKEMQGVVFIESGTNKRVTLTWQDLGAMIMADGGSLMEDRGKDKGFYSQDIIPIITIDSSEMQMRDDRPKYGLKYYEEGFSWAKFSEKFDKEPKRDDDGNVIEGQFTTEMSQLGFEQMNKAIAELTNTDELADNVIGATDKQFQTTAGVFSKDKLKKYMEGKNAKTVVYPARTFTVSVSKVDIVAEVEADK